MRTEMDKRRTERKWNSVEWNRNGTEMETDRTDKTVNETEW